MTTIQKKPKSNGRLIWKDRKVLSRDTTIGVVDGKLVTEVVYSIPVVFDGEAPKKIVASRMVGALESVLEKSYSNFVNISKFIIEVSNNEFSILVSVIFLDYGPVNA